MVAGVILAAGRSSRMGRPKALLRHVPSGYTFVGHLIRTARGAGLEPLLVVGRPGDRALASEVDRHGAALVPNIDPDRGQLSSIQSGLSAAAALGATAIVVLPVDVPLVSTGVLTALLRAIDDDRVGIARASYRGQHGHPVLFTNAVFDELRRADPAVGARAVVRADPARVKEVAVDDPGVIFDLDTPEDYRRAFGRDL
jgi:CTP:molybdopterin cytidylyltransferase MocA